MTATLSPTGELLVPEELRTQLHLAPGDDFDVLVDDDNTITFRRIPPGEEKGWLEWFRACPGPLELPERDKDDKLSLEL